jgi:hypothetical protein
MIRELEIRNFRGFSHLKVEGLNRVNVITGANAAGKTSILEALFMCAGAGALSVSFQLRAYRQLSNKIDLNLDTRQYEGLWEDLFHQEDSAKIIQIDGTGDEADSRSIRIFHEHRGSQLIPFDTDTPVASTSNPQIISEWRRNDEPPITVKPKITAQGITFDNTPFEHFPVMMFGPHIADTAEEVARRFSSLSRTGEIESVIKSLCDEFDFIEGLSLEYLSGAPAVFAKLKYQNRKLPLGFVSDGVHKLFSILLGIALTKNGLVLIDQIEDGFYFKKFDSLWRLILRASKDNNCQLFVSTHSAECLRGLLPTIKGYGQDFSLLYADRMQDLLTLHTVEGKFFEAALEQGFEVR